MILTPSVFGAVLIAVLVAMVGSVIQRRLHERLARRPARQPARRPGGDTGGSVRRPATARRSAVRRNGRWPAIGIGAVAGTLLFGPLLIVVVIGGALVARRLRPIVEDRRRRRSVDRCVPDAIELFVLMIQAGLTPIEALQELTASAPSIARHGFAAVVHRLERGEQLATALRALPDLLGSGMVGLADAIAGADRYGLPLAPVLESLALEARAARRRQDEADARRLPIRLSFPLVVCTLPSFVLLAIAPATIAALSSLSSSI